MGEGSAIEWTDHTFNPWIGCTKVSAGCANCYAERDFDHRRGFARWGKGQPRRMTGASTWAAPKRWDRQAYENRAAWLAGVRPRVFCASLADVFDAEVPDEWRDQLFMLIHECTNLTWLLLTKRPAEAARYMGRIAGMSRTEHVWIGTSVEDQATADERIPQLLQVPATRRFLSCEPLLGPVDLRRLPELRLSDHDAPPGPRSPPLRLNALTGDHWLPSGRDHMGLRGAKIDWVIAGGESGLKARPMNSAWVQTLRNQCKSAGVPFFFKQWGEWLPVDQTDHLSAEDPYWDNPKVLTVCTDGHVQGAMEDMDVGAHSHCSDTVRVGKKRAGRLLDGRTWDEVPPCRS